jgi:hypothetical protein
LKKSEDPSKETNGKSLYGFWNWKWLD